MDEINVSVIIPVYNSEEYIENTIKCLLKQTIKNLQIIFVNDGSTDKSLEILEQYAKQNSNILVFSQINKGAGAARNFGVKMAKGKYIAFMDSDDYIYPQMYEELYIKAENEQADMVISGFIETTDGDNILFPNINSEIKREHIELGSFQAIEYPEIIGNVFLWNRLYLREFWIRNNFTIPEKRKFAEDLLICTQTAVKASKIGYVYSKHYKYRNYRENSLSDILVKCKNKEDYILAVKETKKFLEDENIYSFFQKDFLIFVVHLYFVIIERINNYSIMKRFSVEMNEIINKKDWNIINGTWLKMVKKNELKYLENKKFFRLFCSILLKKYFINNILER